MDNLAKYFRDFKFSSYFFKLLASCILIALIPIVVLNFFSAKMFFEKFSNYSGKITSEKMFYNTEMVLSENLMGVYSSLAQVFDSSEFASYRKATRHLTLDSIFDAEKIITDIQKAKANNPLINEAGFYFVNSATVLDSVTKYDYEPYFNRKLDIDGMTADDWLIFLKSNKKRYLRIGDPQSPDSRIAFIVGLPLQSPFPDVYLVATLDDGRILRLLNGSNNSADQKNFIFDESGALVIKSDPDFDPALLHQDKNLKDLFAGSAGSFRTDISGESALVIYSTVPSLGWRIVSLDEMTDFHRASKAVTAFSITLSAALIVLCFFASAVLSYMSYKPIVNILQFLESNQTRLPPVSRKHASELNVIQQSLESFAHQSREFEDFQSFSIEYLLERFYYGIAKGHISNDNELQQYRHELGAKFDDKYYTVAVVKINESQSYRYLKKSSGATINHIQMYMKSVLTALSGDSANAYVFYDNKNMGAIFGYAAMFSLHDLLKAFQSRIENELGITVSIGISGVKTDWIAVSEAYAEACDILKIYNFNADNLIVEYGKDKDTQHAPVYFPLENEQLIASLLAGGNQGKLEKIIKNVFEVNFSRGTTRYTDVMYVAHQFVNIAIRAIFDHGKSVPEIYSKQIDLYSEVNKIENFDDMQRFIIGQYAVISNRLPALLQSNDEIRERIKDYIAEKYVRDISITTIAEEFSLSPEYFAKYFKSLMGVGFPDMVNSYRIKKALELMRSNNRLTFAEIAASVGFNSYKSFARNFKKYTGCSPGDFRSEKN